MLPMGVKKIAARSETVEDAFILYLNGEISSTSLEDFKGTIKAALERISEHHPALGHYLASTINTGTYCSYTPDMNLPSPWKL